MPTKLEDVYDAAKRDGWTRGEAAAAKRAAMRAASGRRVARPPTITLTSRGRCLVYGAGQNTLEVAQVLARDLDVSVVLTDTSDVVPARGTPNFAKGTITGIRGGLGTFSVATSGLAWPEAGSRGGIDFYPAAELATLEADIVLDLSGGPPLVGGCHDRDGYIRANPRDATALARAALMATSLVGEFEKPRYVELDSGICAHARNRIAGCTNCLDACPAGALSPAGDHVLVDAAVCEGCGLCSGVCPTGAISYRMPAVTDLLGQARLMLAAYAAAGGDHAVLLLHEAEHGEPIFDAMSLDGDGLPANVIPIATHSVMQAGHDLLLGLLASGCSAVSVLVPRRHRAHMSSLSGQMALARALLDGLGMDGTRFEMIIDDDPDAISDSLRSLPLPVSLKIGQFGTSGSKREVERMIIGALRACAPISPGAIALPAGSPYGRVVLDESRCTLCLSCAAVCPTNALRDTADRPALKFNEAACVQCGLCVRTCPETALALEPRFDFTAVAGVDRVLKEEEPFNCRSCGKPFGARSSIERVKARLAGNSHFADAGRLALVEMCADCRVVHMLASVSEPLKGKPRPRPTTSDDYLSVSSATKLE